MLWVFEDLVGQATFHNMSVFHDNGAACKLFDDAQIVGHQQHGHLLLPLDAPDQVEHAGLHRQIEATSDFVE